MNIDVLHIYISPVHNYFGHHGGPSGKSALTELDQVECVAGRGLLGDRFFDYKESYKGQITFFAWEVFDDLRRKLTAIDKTPGAFRRNVITRGVQLNTLIDKEFEIQGIRFIGVSECSPCYWMDEAFAPGAEAALKGNGGLRARILNDGWRRRNAVE